MRVSLLVVSCIVLMIHPAVAQLGQLETPFGVSSLSAGDSHLPIGSDAGLRQLEWSALAGDRNASVLLAVLLQDAPDIQGNLIKSALHFQLAIAAGCSDVAALAQRALTRLSPDERAEYDRVLSRFISAPATAKAAGPHGRCLAWKRPIRPY